MTCKLCSSNETYTLKKYVIRNGITGEVPASRIPLCDTCLETNFDEFIGKTKIGVLNTGNLPKMKMIVNILNTDIGISYNIWLLVNEKSKIKIATMNSKSLSSKMKSKVIGQDHCIDKLMYVYDRFVLSKRNPKIKKNNLMIIGDTGTGKTEMVETMATELNIPMLSINCANLTPSGYKGSNASDMVGAFLSDIGSSDAIVYLDEVDKFTSNNDDFDKTAVQRDLLKLIESNIYTVTDKHETSTYNTSNILFIASGSFPEIKKKKTVVARKEVGLNSKPQAAKVRTPVEAEDLFLCGLIPEFIGRFQSFTETNEMTKELLKKILSDSSNSPLNEINEIASELDKTVEIDAEYLDKIVEIAVTQKTGARGIKQALDSFVEKLFLHKKSKFKIHDNAKSRAA